MFTIAAVFQTGAFYIYLWRNLHRSLHMMQQNSYYNDRYTQWLKRNPSKLPGYLLLVTILSSILLRGFLSLNLYLLIHGVLFLALGFVRSKTKEKTPLVFTWRVKRLLITAGLLCFLYIWGMSLLFPETFWWEIPFLQALLNWLLQVFVVAANLINKPLEKHIADGFIRDANRILEEHPGLTVIGITGSYGKTSTKHILHHLLGARYEVLMTPESYNTTMGVVRTIREQLKATHKILVVEMGAKKPGDIREICQMVRPVAGIITSIGEMHLDTFETMENIVQTKFELAEAVGSEGLMVLNDDNFYIRHQRVAAPALRYRTKTENAGEEEWQGTPAGGWAGNKHAAAGGGGIDKIGRGN
ncbi:MAG: Mur ligase family protein, partial [Clostridiales bacterium]|nr:Mur ligase family protein [Clostridiales bacterium]